MRPCRQSLGGEEVRVSVLREPGVCLRRKRGVWGLMILEAGRV